MRLDVRSTAAAAAGTPLGSEAARAGAPVASARSASLVVRPYCASVPRPGSRGADADKDDRDGCPTYAPAGPYRLALEVLEGGLGPLGVAEGSVLAVGGAREP